MSWTLVGDPRYYPDGYLSYCRSIVVVKIPLADEAWLIDDIKTVGGLIFATEKEAKIKAKSENFPDPAPPLEHFPRARGVFTGRCRVGRQPIYVPDWKLWHVEQVLRNLALNAEHDGMHIEEMVAHATQVVEGALDADVACVLARLNASGVLVTDKKKIVKGWEYAR